MNSKYKKIFWRLVVRSRSWLLEENIIWRVQNDKGREAEDRRAACQVSIGPDDLVQREDAQTKRYLCEGLKFAFRNSLHKQCENSRPFPEWVKRIKGWKRTWTGWPSFLPIFSRQDKKCRRDTEWRMKSYSRSLLRTFRVSCAFRLCRKCQRRKLHQFHRQ